MEYYNDNSHLGALSTFAKQSWWRDTKKEDMSSLRFEPLDPRRDADAAFYLRCYRDSWVVAHGSDAGFVSSVYLSSARSHAAKAPGCLMKVMSGDTPVGVLELDPRRGRDDGCGWISLLYLLPEFRDHGLGVQLIGCAAAYFEGQGPARAAPARGRHQRTRHRLLRALRLQKTAAGRPASPPSST